MGFSYEVIATIHSTEQKAFCKVKRKQSILLRFYCFYLFSYPPDKNSNAFQVVEFWNDDFNLLMGVLSIKICYILRVWSSQTGKRISLLRLMKRNHCLKGLQDWSTNVKIMWNREMLPTFPRNQKPNEKAEVIQGYSSEKTWKIRITHNDTWSTH